VGRSRATARAAAAASDAILTAEVDGSRAVLAGKGMGCVNWHTASLEAAIADDAAVCVERCHATPGCVSVNYQVKANNDFPDVGTCYLLDEQCLMAADDLWDAYTLPESERTETHMEGHVSRSTGCSNLAEITQGKETLEWSAYECLEKCEANAGCTGVTVEASMPNCGDVMGKRKCQLLYGGCSEIQSSKYNCVDLHYKTSWTHPVDRGTSTTTRTDHNSDLLELSADAGDGSEEFSVDRPNCFLVGDTVELLGTDLANDLKQDYTIASIAGTTITVTPALTHFMAAGTSVLRIKHPHPPTTCGEWPVV
jgi:hypothetical protein